MVRFILSLCLLLMLGTSGYAQSVELNAYQTQSVLLKPSKAGVLVNGNFHAHGTFYRGLRTVLRGEEALAALEAASLNKKQSLLWLAGSGILLIGASGLVMYAPIAAGGAVLLSIITSHRHMAKEMAAADGLQEALWLHNLRVMEEVVRQ